MAAPLTVPAKTLGFFLNGRWVREGLPIDVTSPYDGSVVGSTFQATGAHLQAAIAAAARAFEVTRKMPAYQRQSVLRCVAQGIASRRDELALTMALEAGKPLKAARVEVERAIFTFTVAAEESTRIGGEWIPMDLLASSAGRAGIVRRFPLGPIAAITPFNFPLNLVAHKVAPAIAAGCSVVLKPAPQTPLSALLLAELVEKAGWPGGALNVLPLATVDAETLVTDERLKLLTFTGSGAVGWMLKAKAGKKRVALELGGNAGVIVHSDADLAYAAERCAQGGFSYAGQSCISVQRIFVQESVQAQFLDALLPRVRQLRVGNPLEESTDVGPLISEQAARRAAEWIEEAVAGGAKVLAGGQRQKSFVPPTVLTGTQARMRVNCEEVFAPVVVVEPYGDFAEAIRRINDSPYGLQAGVFTRDIRLLLLAFEELEVGGVMAGDVPTFRVDHMPYGGVKASGLGREGLRYAIEEMTEPRLLVLSTT